MKLQREERKGKGWYFGKIYGFLLYLDEYSLSLCSQAYLFLGT